MICIIFAILKLYICENELKSLTHHKSYWKNNHATE